MMSLAQLKVLQEVITLLVFLPFAILYMHQQIRLNYLWAGLCLVGSVYFMFRSSKTYENDPRPQPQKVSWNKRPCLRSVSTWRCCELVRKRRRREKRRGLAARRSHARTWRAETHSACLRRGDSAHRGESGFAAGAPG